MTHGHFPPVTSLLFKPTAVHAPGLIRMLAILSALIGALIVSLVLAPQMRLVTWGVFVPSAAVVMLQLLSAKHNGAFDSGALRSIARQGAAAHDAAGLEKALLNSISHDLRSPITSVIGALSTMLEGDVWLDNSERRRLLETARDEAARLNRLIQNLLDISRLEGGAIQLKRAPSDVYEVIGAALEQLGEEARKRRVLVQIVPGLPLVPIDQALIVQVLANLVDNALKYSPPETPVEITARLRRRRLEIGVADHGCGIRAQDLERVFDKFYRGAVAGTPQGSGLGLSICKGFVGAHDGRIWATRRAQGGTEVVFSLPVEVAGNA